MRTVKLFPMASMERSQEKHSAFRSEFWGICCESGKKYSQVVRKKFHLSMAALDPTVSGSSPCVSLMVERGGCQYLLCNLKPDSILQVNLNLYFDMGEKVTFSLKGRGTVHLSGYHIFQEGDRSSSNDSSKSPVRSPIKNNSLGDIAVDEETSEEYEDSSEEDDDDDDDEEEELMTKLKKNPALAKVAPKANAAITTPKKVPTPQGTPSKKDNVSKTNVKAVALKTIMKDQSKNFSKRTLEEESSDEDDESSEEESDDSLDKAPPKQKPKDLQNNKRLKTDTSTPMVGKKMANQSTPKLFAELIDLEDDASQSTPKSNKGELNSSIGRTPMPKKSVSLSDALGSKKTPKATVGDDDSSGDDSDEMDTSLVNKSMQSSTEQLNASTESKKKRKKKKKKAAAAANDSKVLENTPAKLNDSMPAFKSAKKLPGGVEYEDIRAGQGLEAKRGKLVHVYYTGKLGNNKVFDSRQPGSKPFSFKLGSGQVIKGWDVGLEGMKVGGKRKLKIPPHMAYKDQRMGDIPPSSTLYFIVELKAVS